MSSDWVSKISDDTRINELAIPGTHDAAAWTAKSNWDKGWWTTPGTWAQRKSITEQLDMGVRALDLRVGWSMGLGWYIGMYHGPIYLGLTLQDVLTDVKNWLARHDKEFVILIFQQQGSIAKADMAKEIRKMVFDTFGLSLYQVFEGQTEWPAVSKLRGKVMVLGRLKSDVQGFCNVRSWLDKGDNTDGTVIEAGRQLRIYLQDRYKELSKAAGFTSMDDDNKKKFEKVKAAAEAKPAVPPLQLLKINHMSYSNLRYQPWESGEGVNTLLRNSNVRIKGVLMIDDADQATVSHILQNNA